MTLNLTQHQSIYYVSNNNNNNNNENKIAAFDLDYTLIKTKSGKLFSGNDSNDWQFAFPKVPNVLRDLHQAGFHLVIFSNQKGLSSNTLQIEHFQTKLSAILATINLPIDVFISTEDDYFRKPCTGMWDKFVELNQNVSLTDSFYCGDAAGRPADFTPGHKKDFSSSDLFFAHNIGLEFRLPENVFLGANYPIPTLKAHQFQENIQPTNLTIPIFPSNNQHKLFIMMVGSPASGKSTYAKSLAINGLIRINQDELGTKAKCLKAVKQAISKGENVIVDNTNPSVVGRKEYLDLVPESYLKTVICMKVDKKLAHHLNYVRVQRGKGQIKKIPDIAFNVYFKKFEEPTEAEGFDGVCYEPFVPKADIKELQYHYID